MLPVVLELDAGRTKLPVGDGLEENDQTLNKALVEMSEAADLFRGGVEHHAGVIALNEEIGVGGVAEQALIILRAAEAFAEGGTAKKQVFQDLALVGGEQLTKMQANIRITGHIFNRLPEIQLGAVGGSQLVGVYVIFVNAETAEYCIGVDTLLLHRLINQT